MKIEQSGCCEPAKLCWAECTKGEVYKWAPTNEYYMKLDGSGSVQLRNGSYSNSMVSDRSWIHVPHAKVVV